MDDLEKIIQLEKDLDEALAKAFNQEKELRRLEVVQYELEELVRNIYHECLNLKQSEKKPDVNTLLENLSSNIRRLAKAYGIDL